MSWLIKFRGENHWNKLLDENGRELWNYTDDTKAIDLAYEKYHDKKWELQFCSPVISNH